MRSISFAAVLAWLAPIPALAIGTIVMQRSDIPTSIWSQNLIVGTIMFLLFPVIRNLKSERSAWQHYAILATAVTAMAVTLLEPGRAGVHRWLYFASIQVEAAEVFLPIILIQLGLLKRRIALVIVAAVLGVLAAQPDAALASAFGIATFVIVFPNLRGLAEKSGFSLLLLCFILWTWKRPDPLEAVPHVEEIVRLASNQGRLWALGAVGALVLLPVPFLYAALHQNDTAKLTARGLTVFFAIRLLSILVGNFPVPILGYGASPVIGYFLALVWLPKLPSQPQAHVWGYCRDHKPTDQRDSENSSIRGNKTPSSNPDAKNTAHAQ